LHHAKAIVSFRLIRTWLGLRTIIHWRHRARRHYALPEQDKGNTVYGLGGAVARRI